MLKRIWMIFLRDLKVNTRESISLFILVMPLLLAFGINWITPSISDTTIRVAVIDGEDRARSAYFDQFAHVSGLSSRDNVEARVLQRDHVLGLVRQGGDTLILSQGNEPRSAVDYAKLLNALYESGTSASEARAEIIEFGRTIPPLKKLMVNVCLLFISVLSGMLIALNIIEEKNDRTISAMHVSPTTRLAFIFGKASIGVVSAMVLSVACLLITGFRQVDFVQAILVVLATTFLSLTIGFVQGLGSNDVMEAAGSVKLMFLPLAGSIAAYELLANKWHVFLYWSPFYWAYRANDQILSQVRDWPQMLLYLGAIILICGAVFAILAPRIHRGLQAS